MKHDSDTPGTAARSRVAALRNLRGYKVAEGDPDVRGWEVVGGDGLRIGTVNDLLVDTVEGKARYLDIELDTAEIDPNPGASTTTEYLVRATLSDTENEMTAHHHLDSRHHPNERHVVFPVGQAELDAEHDRVVLASQRADDAANLPAYVPGEVSPDYEHALRQWFDPSFTPSAGQDLYAHDLYDEDRFYKNRRTAPIRGR